MSPKHCSDGANMGKRKYVTKIDALLAGANRKGHVSVFRCNYCRFFHLTSKVKK